MTQRESPATARQTIVLALLLAVFIALVGAIDFSTDIGTDYGAYFSHGWFITKGLAPYRDFWTHKTPLLPVLIAGWIGVFGPGFYPAVIFPLLVTFGASVAVYAFALALQLGWRIAAGSSFLFALFAASHVLDPTRNGVITIAAVALELLSMILALLGVRHGRAAYLAAAGLVIVLAVATRQTSALICLPVAVAVVFLRGRDLRRAATEVGIIAAAVLAGLAASALALGVAGVPLDTVWDQIYSFNLVYAAGYRIKITWWLSGWMQLIVRDGLVILVPGGAWLAWTWWRTIRGRAPVDLAALLLGVMAVVHLVTIYLSHKIQAIYLFQLLPELCIAVAILVNRILLAPAPTRLAPSRRLMGAVATVVLLAWPIGLEAAHWREAVTSAKAAGHFFDARNLPSQVMARQIRQLVPRESGRIWICSASADAVYAFAERLPATRFTSVARLIYVMGPDDFEHWRDDFERHAPRLVVNAYGEAWVREATARPREWNGRDMTTVLRIRAYLVETFRRADGLTPPIEAYVRVNEP